MNTILLHNLIKRSLIKTSRVRPPNGGRRPLHRRAAPVAAQTRRAAPVPDRCTDAPRRAPAPARWLYVTTGAA